MASWSKVMVRVMLAPSSLLPEGGIVFQHGKQAVEAHSDALLVDGLLAHVHMAAVLIGNFRHLPGRHIVAQHRGGLGFFPLGEVSEVDGAGAAVHRLVALVGHHRPHHVAVGVVLMGQLVQLRLQVGDGSRLRFNGNGHHFVAGGAGVQQGTAGEQSQTQQEGAEQCSNFFHRGFLSEQGVFRR